MFTDDKLAYWILGIFAAFSAAVYIIKPGGEPAMNILTNIISVSAAAFALFFGILAARSSGADLKIIWYYVSIGMGLYLLGEASWAVQEVFLNISNPYPSIADLFWLAGYPPLLIGFFLAARSLRIGLSNREKWMIVGFVIAILILTSWLLLLPVASSTDIDFGEKALDIIYPLADIAIFVPAFVLALMFGRSMLGKPWRTACIGFLLLGLADFIFSYLTRNELYQINVNQPGNYVDLLWLGGYLFIAAGAHQFKNLTSITD